MKNLRKSMSVVLILLVSLFCLSTVAFASTSEQDGLKVELTTDKENYSLNEDIKINVTVTNTNDITVENVKIDTLLPEKFTLKDRNKSTSSEAVDIPAGKKIEFSVVAVVKDGKSDKTSSDTDSKLTGTSTNNKGNINKQNDKSPYTGKDYAVMTGFSALFIIGIVLLILCLKRNRKKTSKAVSSALCLVLAITSIIGLADFKAKAENKQSDTDTSSVISISENIPVDGKDYTIETNVNYMTKEELTNYNLTEWVKSEETISNTVENLRKTEEYKSANYNEKVQLMEQCLKQLQEKGLIKNLHYNDYIFHFDYSISGSGGIVVKDTHNDNCWGSSPNARTKPIEFNQSIFNETLLNYANSTSTANSKNQNWAFIFGTSTTTEDNMSYNQFNWLASECKDLDINVSVQGNSTVSMYRNLSNKDLIYITGHAFYDEQKSIPVIWTSEQLTKEKLTNINYLFGIIPDINNNSIGIYKNESGQTFFVILPAFFENNYSNNELAGSIVLFGHCQIFGNKDEECLALYNSLKKSGASTVIGFRNSVDQGYSLFFHEKIINCLLRGKTIGDAFNEAKDSIGKNENEYFKEHHSNLSSKEKPAFPILKGLTNKKLIYSDLEKLGEYGFTIKDIDSQKPIENVRVLIYNSENGRECVHSYKSNEKGDVSVELPDGKYTCELVHSLYETMTQNITIKSGVTTIVKNAPIYMKRKISTGSITGIVKDSTTNNPIKDVQVEVIDNSSDSFDPITTTKTNENGNFSLNLPYGSYSISFNHSNYDYYGMTVDVDCETVVLTEPVLLKPAKTPEKKDITGYAYDSDSFTNNSKKTPILDVIIEVYKDNNLIAKTTTDKNGKYSIAVDKNESYYLLFKKSGYNDEIKKLTNVKFSSIINAYLIKSGNGGVAKTIWEGSEDLFSWNRAVELGIAGIPIAEKGGIITLYYESDGVAEIEVINKLGDTWTWTPIKDVEGNECFGFDTIGGKLQIQLTAEQAQQFATSKAIFLKGENAVVTKLTYTPPVQ